MIPNEKLAGGILRNDTLATRWSGSRCVWLPPDADAAAPCACWSRRRADRRVAETTPDGVRLTVTGERCPPPERAGREAELRLQCLTGCGPRACSTPE